MSPRSLLTFLAAALLSHATGCASADIQINHPLTSGTLDRNTIVKETDENEGGSGLPPGTLSWQAHLIRADRRDLCFQISVSSLSPVDLRRAGIKVSAPKVAGLGNPQLDAEPVRMAAHNGQIPEQRQTGMETVCVERYNNICQRWQTRPTYATYMIPGIINVTTSRGKACFPNDGILTPETQLISLEVDVQRPGRPGFFGAPDSRSETFSWGFLGAAMPAEKAERSEKPAPRRRKKQVAEPEED